ncbi:bifunctional riboflavin kinase/FAD synthetase [bacterium]|nr:bifunctional riboflavin kinase/FAD synthetase [bacterium]
MIINRLFYQNERLSVYSYLYEHRKISILSGTRNLSGKLTDDVLNIGIGGFDGFHLGHREIVKDLGKKNKNAIITFHPLPKYYFHRSKHFNIYTLNEKILIAKYQLNLDVMNIFIFNEEFSKISPDRFITDMLLKRFNIGLLVAGINFRFGSMQEGNTEYLKDMLGKNDIPCNIIPNVNYNNEIISSTGIRKFIYNGNISEVNSRLGNPFFFYGRVVKGRNIGKKLGYPTINLKLSSSKIIPPSGVYLSRTEVNGKLYNSISYIGNAPTFNNKRLILETYIDNFHENIYNRSVNVLLLKFLRTEIKFSSIDGLKQQISEDLEKMRRFDD